MERLLWYFILYSFLGFLVEVAFARVVRAEFARCKEQNYVKSARLMGASDLRIMALHILPNIMQVLLPSITIGFNNAILSEASMSFLGLGIQPPEASLGSMLSDSQTYLLSAPWYALCTGGTMVLFPAFPFFVGQYGDIIPVYHVDCKKDLLAHLATKKQPSQTP